MKNETKDVTTTTYVPTIPEHYTPEYYISELTGKGWTLSTKKKQYNFSGAIPDRDTYIKKVIYSEPATVVFWSDDTKTVCKCKYPDTYSREVGFSLCVLKKIYGATAFKKLLKDWVPAQDSFIAQQVTLKDVMKSNK